MYERPFFYENYIILKEVMKKNISIHQLLDILLGGKGKYFLGRSLPLNLQYKKEELEDIYQSKIKGLSRAYLSGSSWYVGPSIIDYIESKLINRGEIFTLVCMSRYI